MATDGVESEGLDGHHMVRGLPWLHGFSVACLVLYCIAGSNIVMVHFTGANLLQLEVKNFASLAHDAQQYSEMFTVAGYDWCDIPRLSLVA